MNIPDSESREERLTKYWSSLIDLVTKLIISASPSASASVCLTPECIQIMDKYGLILHLKLSD